MQEEFKLPVWILWLQLGVFIIINLGFFLMVINGKKEVQGDEEYITNTFFSNIIFFAVAIWLYYMRLVVTYGDDAILIHFHLIPFGKKSISYKTIKSFTTKDNKLLSYGGYGIRRGFKSIGYIADSPHLMVVHTTVSKLKIVWSLQDEFEVSRWLDKKISRNG